MKNKTEEEEEEEADLLPSLDPHKVRADEGAAMKRESSSSSINKHALPCPAPAVSFKCLPPLLLFPTCQAEFRLTVEEIFEIPSASYRQMTGLSHALLLLFSFTNQSVIFWKWHRAVVSGKWPRRPQLSSSGNSSPSIIDDVMMRLITGVSRVSKRIRGCLRAPETEKERETVFPFCSGWKKTGHQPQEKKECAKRKELQ